MTEQEEQEIRQELVGLRQEHRDLDTAIAALVESGRADHLTIQRLKKRKLAIRDRIQHLEDRLVPDIIA
ncbi:YdcH family protein [Prosthecomicrobium sp. N25]|uniref:YdcH family protein n=1 Tax=Prosthecomicrobium sp. N25 TaxID=3129254 RepID=UPI003076BBAE